MKKFSIIFISILSALTVGAMALANTAAVELYDRTAELLFNTDNVTVKAHAEFSLDGSRFKTADGEWKQDGDRSYRQLLLSSPRKDGTERKNGYTIVTEKNDLYLMEVFTPGVCRRGSTGERLSILRSTVESKHLVQLGKALASQADLLLGADTITKTEDGSYRVALGEDAPDLVNAVLNQIARFAAKRYFMVDFDRNRTDSEMSMNGFVTVTTGILYTMQGISLRKAEITLKPDENGELLLAEGSVSLNLETSADGVKQLDVSFRVEISGRGSTVLKKFDPQDYGAKMAYYAEPAFGAEFGGEYGEATNVINEEAQ